MGFISGLLGGQTGAGFQAVGPDASKQGNQGQAAIANAQGNQAYNQQQNFVNQLQGINGIGALQGIANGTGPNPAQAMLNNATGANNAAQAALMAGQRGASANPGLIARQAAQQGSANQQNAIGQGAALQAQQSLNAENTLAGMQQNSLQNLNQFAGNQQQNANSALSSQNSVNAGVAGQNAKSQASGLGGLLSGVGLAANPIMSMFGSGTPTNPLSAPGADLGLNSGAVGSAGNAGIAGTSPILAGAGDVAPALAFASEGGQVPQQLDHRALYMQAIHPFNSTPTAMSAGGSVPALLSPGEEYLPPEQAKAVAEGNAHPLSGQRVPGQAKVKGDSQKNDVVPAELEPGGVVVPRSKMKSAPDAAKFVAAVMARQGMKRK